MKYELDESGQNDLKNSLIKALKFDAGWQDKTLQDVLIELKNQLETVSGKEFKYACADALGTDSVQIAHPKNYSSNSDDITYTQFLNITSRRENPYLNHEKNPYSVFEQKWLDIASHVVKLQETKVENLTGLVEGCIIRGKRLQKYILDKHPEWSDNTSQIQALCHNDHKLLRNTPDEIVIEFGKIVEEFNKKYGQRTETNKSFIQEIGNLAGIKVYDGSATVGKALDALNKLNVSVDEVVERATHDDNCIACDPLLVESVKNFGKWLKKEKGLKEGGMTTSGLLTPYTQNAVLIAIEDAKNMQKAEQNIDSFTSRVKAKRAEFANREL